MTKRLLHYGRGALLLGLVVLMAAASSGALQALLRPAELSRQTVSAAPLRSGRQGTAQIAPQTDGALDVAQAGDNDDDEDNDSVSLLSIDDNEDNSSDADNEDNDAEDNELDAVEDMVIENVSPSSTTIAPAAAPAVAPAAVPSPTAVPLLRPCRTRCPVPPLDPDAVLDNVS